MVKSHLKLLCIFMLISSVTVVAAENPPSVEKLRNGFYVSSVSLDGRVVKRYLVDTRAQLCFSSNEVIPCENLKMRDEWRDIISWVR